MLRILFVSIWFALHPVHVTLTSVEYVPENSSFTVFLRMYFDDFLRDYKLTLGEIAEKGFSGENSESVEAMKKYLSEKVVLTVNGKILSAGLKEMNLSDNEVSMNLIYSSNRKPKSVSVKNLIMTTLYTDQANMIIVKVNDFEEGVKLTSDITEQTFKIK
jgi:hypothetical protein